MQTTIRQADVDAYVLRLFKEKRAAATIKKYHHDAARFLHFLGGRELNRELVVEFKAQLCERYAPRSANSMLAAVNGLLEAVGRSDLRVKRLRIQRQMFCARERELSRGEYKKLVTTAQKRGNDRLSLILQTLCSTGIRSGELRSITRAAAKAGKAVVNNKGKTRIVLLPRRLCGLLASYCRKRDIESGPVFRTRSGKPIDRSNVWAEMKQLCDWAGVSRDKVFPHNLRHLFARAFYSVEKDISRLADILGHSSVETTRIYIVSSGEEHERQLARLNLVI